MHKINDIHDVTGIITELIGILRPEVPIITIRYGCRWDTLRVNEKKNMCKNKIKAFKDMMKTEEQEKSHILV